MKPLDVPTTSETVTLRQVGRPKLRLPTSEKTCAVMVLSLVHRTTSQGACGVSAPWSTASGWKTMLLATEDCRECGDKNAGDWTRGDDSGEGDSRDEKRRSNGCREVGRCGRRDVCETGRLLPGEDKPEPWSGLDGGWTGGRGGGGGGGGGRVAVTYQYRGRVIGRRR